MHSVSTTQAPFVEHRSETDCLTTAVEMAEAWNETWWHSDMLVVFVPPTAEVSCCGTFLLAVRCWKPKRSHSVSHRDGWEAVLLAPWSPMSDLQQSGHAMNTGHQHRKGWQSAGTGAQMGTQSVKHLTFMRNKFCLHQTGTALQCHTQCPVSAPGSWRPALAAAKGCTGWLLVSSSLRFPTVSLLDAGVLALRFPLWEKLRKPYLWLLQRGKLLQLALAWVRMKMFKVLSEVCYHLRGTVSPAVQIFHAVPLPPAYLSYSRLNAECNSH